MRTLALVLFGVIVILLVILVAVPTPASHPSYIHGQKLDVSAAITYWTARIHAVGPRAAHDEMVAQAQHLPQQHAIAHAFGEALYDVGGSGYITYCGDGEFLWGCYHQMMGLEAAHDGKAAVEEMRGACPTDPLHAEACAHGIGHGVESLEGYTNAGIARSLADCTTLYPDDVSLQHECADGAYMEYNLQEMAGLDDGTPHVRAFSTSDAYAPCDATRTFISECASELPIWWSFALASSTPDTKTLFAKLGAMCRAMPESDRVVRVCFIGISWPAMRLAASNEHATVANCKSAAQNDEEYAACAAGAARRFIPLGRTGDEVCAAFGLSGVGESYCETAASSTRPFSVPYP